MLKLLPYKKLLLRVFFNFTCLTFVYSEDCRIMLDSHLFYFSNSRYIQKLNGFSPIIYHNVEREKHFHSFFIIPSDTKQIHFKVMSLKVAITSVLGVPLPSSLVYFYLLLQQWLYSLL